MAYTGLKLVDSILSALLACGQCQLLASTAGTVAVYSALARLIALGRIRQAYHRQVLHEGSHLHSILLVLRCAGRACDMSQQQLQYQCHWNDSLAG